MKNDECVQFILSNTTALKIDGNARLEINISSLTPEVLSKVLLALSMVIDTIRHDSTELKLDVSMLEIPETILDIYLKFGDDENYYDLNFLNGAAVNGEKHIIDWIDISRIFADIMRKGCKFSEINEIQLGRDNK